MKREFALPGARSHYAPDHACDIEHIRLAVDIDVEARSIRGRASLTLAPVRGWPRPPAEAELRGGDQGPSDAGPLGIDGWLSLDAVELDVHEVSCAGRALRYRYDGKVLQVSTEGLAPSSEGGAAVLDIDYSASPRRGLYFVGPDEGYPDKPVQVWSQGQDEDSRYWFPCFDAPHEKATSEVVATVPGSFTVLSNGRLVSDTLDQDSGRRTVCWRLDSPHSVYLISLVAAELAVVRDAWGEVEVSYYVTPGREDEARRTLARTPEMVALFSRTFGVVYPYEKYAQVFVADFIFGGMENTTATTLTDQVLLDERAALDHDVEGLVAHELAHQWFGDLVTCRDWSQGWLNEGFATYAEYVWREHAHGRDEAALERRSWAQAYHDEDGHRYRRKIATRVYDAPIDVFDRHLYEKGACVLHMLRRLLGDALFWRGIEYYLNEHRGRAVEIRDLARSLERATGRVLDWFFEQWLTDGAGHPELDVAYQWDPGRGVAKLRVRQTQSVDETTPLFRLPATVRFRVGERDVDHALDIREAEQVFFVPLDEAPRQVIFDPGKHLLVEVVMDSDEVLLVDELAAATEAIDRADAARRLGRRGGRKVTEALVRGLDGDDFWGVRAACAAALGEVRSGAARQALVDAIGTEHPKVRRAVVQALGEFRGDERAADVLLGLVDSGDPSYFVEAEACLALGKTRSARAGAALRRAAERDSYRDIIRQRAYLGLAAARDDGAAELLRTACAYGRPVGGRRAALAALAQLSRGRRDRDARDARELAEHLLRDRDYRVQRAAIDALGELGDPAAISALETLVERAIDGRLRRRAREVTRDLRGGQQEVERQQTMQDQLDRVRARVADLEQRLEAALSRLEHDAKGGKKGKKKKKK
ncbi:M1 family aminopeptidase [Haliangium sp.]|uniref:M1 family aminopeptidase n=1 Tax=Haliangium sp. TaxID=2663208 RepID=UPI003D0D7B6F